MTTKAKEATKEALPYLIEWENRETELFRVGKPYEAGGEVFKGCLHCLTDGYLEDVETE